MSKTDEEIVRAIEAARLTLNERVRDAVVRGLRVEIRTEELHEIGYRWGRPLLRIDVLKPLASSEKATSSAPDGGRII